MKKISLHTAIEVYTYEELTDQQKTLIQKAKETYLSAYSPYSKFSVGAAILREGCLTNHQKKNCKRKEFNCF